MVDRTGAEIAALGTEARERLAAYVDLVRRRAGRLDLISPADLDRVWERHVADSLRLVPFLETLPPGACVDVGSGAGFPGVVLAAAGPRRRWRLVEPRRIKAAFLEEVVRSLGLEAEVVTARAEDLAGDARFARGHALAVARALAPPETALRLLRPLVEPGGFAALFVGRRSQAPPGTELWRPGLAIMRVTGG